MSIWLEANKGNVPAFYDSMFNIHKPEEALEKYLEYNEIQHYPEVGEGNWKVGYNTGSLSIYKGEKCEYRIKILA